MLRYLIASAAVSVSFCSLHAYPGEPFAGVKSDIKTEEAARLGLGKRETLAEADALGILL